MCDPLPIGHVGWQDRQLCCLPFYYADPAIQLLTSLASRGPGANPAMAGMQSMSGPSGPSFSESNLAKIAQGINRCFTHSRIFIRQGFLDEGFGTVP